MQPDTVTGDLVFVIKQKEHPKFKRKGDDLFVEHKLSITEALCGFQFVLTHLDGRSLLIKSNPGEVIKPGKKTSKLTKHCMLITLITNLSLLVKCTDQSKGISDEGMPMHPRPFMKGTLYVHFTVDFPDSLIPKHVKELEAMLVEAILPARPVVQMPPAEIEDCVETTLHDVDMEEEMPRKKAQAQQEAYDEDSHGSGEQRVQCPQQ